MLNKYCDYFKNEWSEYVPEMERFSLNLKEAMGARFHQRIKGVPNTLVSDKKEQFLKKIGALDCFPSKILTPREIDCLTIMSLGMTAKQAGEFLNLSPRTIEAYITNAKNKLGCSSSGELFKLFNEWKHYGICNSKFF